MISFSVSTGVGSGSGRGVIVCCAGDCDVAMGKLKTSGELVFCWAGCQTVVTYYSLVSEHTQQGLLERLRGRIALIRKR